MVLAVGTIGFGSRQMDNLLHHQLEGNPLALDTSFILPIETLTRTGGTFLKTDGIILDKRALHLINF